jgi:hypothetical protein
MRDEDFRVAAADKLEIWYVVWACETLVRNNKTDTYVFVRTHSPRTIVVAPISSLS